VLDRNGLTGKCLMSSALTAKDVYCWASARVERIPVAGSQVGAGTYDEVAQISVKLPSKYPGALCVGTPAAMINAY